MENAFSGLGEPHESKAALGAWSKQALLKQALPKLRACLRQRLALFLTCAGILLLLYVFSQYAQMYVGQRTLASEWRQQNAQPAGASSNNAGDAGDALTRLTIARIQLDAVIVEGTSHQALKLGPGHMEHSALPGSSGNSVIAAHRDTFFRHLDELQQGDEIDVRRQRKVYRFEVTGRQIVEPTDLSVLRQSASAELTLITCYPPHYVGPAPKRLVVVARLMAAGPD
jgi:LPXTG-site transpeptidase (sortase) family protein